MNTLCTNLTRSPTSVGAARRLVNGHTPSLDSQQRRDAVLMVSELVTNAVLHGVGAISLRIDAEAGTIRIEVADEGNVALAPSPQPSDHGGWGLRIVDQLADDWGVLDGRTKVWFRLGRPESGSVSPRPSGIGARGGRHAGGFAETA
jgi:anti-sigma regulatory factor (Ser/Thr protein kinase)